MDHWIVILDAIVDEDPLHQCRPLAILPDLNSRKCSKEAVGPHRWGPEPMRLDLLHRHLSSLPAPQGSTVHPATVVVCTHTHMYMNIYIYIRTHLRKHI